MKVVEALENLGVREDTLSAEERAFLDDNGYLSLPGVLTGEQVRSFNNRLQQLLEDEELLEAPSDFQEGTRIIRDLVFNDALFDVFFTHPRLLACVRHVIGDDFKLSSVCYRSAQPGGGHQGLHPDWHPEWWRDRKRPADRFSCNSIWMLDDFTTENGSTRIVPGSHNGLSFPEDKMDDPKQPHPDEIQLTGPAGTMGVFTGHTWHAGCRNRSDSPRGAVLTYFCRRDQPPQTDYGRILRPEDCERLSREARVILGVVERQPARDQT